jgi:type I restriction enzyme, S subunit
MKQIQTNKIEWKEVELKEIAQFINGRAFKPSDWELEGKLIIRIQDLTGSITNPNYTTKVFENKYLVKKGDLLISWSATLDAFLWNKEEGWLNQHIFKVVPDKKFVDKMYLYYFVKQTIHLFLRESHGSTMKHITKGRFESIKILIPFFEGSPDLKEQERIVSILEKAEKQKEKSKKASELLDEYLKSVFYEMFLKEKEKFEIVELGRVTKIISGSTPSTNKKEYWDGNISWIAPAELVDGHNYYYYETKKKITKEGLKSCSSHLFPKGTVMLTTRAPIGKVAIAGIEMCSNQGFKNFIPLERIISEYLYFWFLLKKDYLNYLGVGATFKEISKSIVSKIKIPLPPLPLQQKFADIVEQIEKMKEQINKTKQNSEELFDSLVSKAFRGEL